MREQEKLSLEELAEYEQSLKEGPTLEEVAAAVKDVEQRLINLGCRKRKNLEIKNETVNFNNQFESVEKLEAIGKNELIQEVENSDIVYVGDYHSSPHHGDVIKYIINMSKDQNMVVGLEMLDREKHPVTIPSREYKKGDFYHTCLGMDREKYLAIIENIREANEVNEETQIEIIGLGNQDDVKKKEGVEKENRIVAQKIAEMAAAEPMRKQIIFYGEEHLAKNRMPAQTQEKMREKKIERRQITIYHDIPRLYFQFMKQNNRPPAPGEAVRIEKDAFCLFTEHPLKKELRCLYSMKTGKAPSEIDLHDERINKLVTEWKANGEWAEEFFE